MFNVELVNGYVDAVVNKHSEVQKESGNPPAGRPRVGERRRRSTVGRCRGSAYEDAGSGALKTPVSKYVAQVAVCAGARLRGRSVAAGALARAAGALGGASDRVGARIGSPPVGQHFS